MPLKGAFQAGFRRRFTAAARLAWRPQVAFNAIDSLWVMSFAAVNFYEGDGCSSIGFPDFRWRARSTCGADRRRARPHAADHNSPRRGAGEPAATDCVRTDLADCRQAVPAVHPRHCALPPQRRFPGLCSDTQAIKTMEEQGYTVVGGDVVAPMPSRKARSGLRPTSCRTSIRAASSFFTCTAAPTHRRRLAHCLRSSPSSVRRVTLSSKYRTYLNCPPASR